MELKVIPVLQVFIALLLMATLKIVMPGLSLIWPGHISISLLLLSVGVFIGVWAIVAFRRHKTTVNPTKPEASSTIVNSGIYAFSRNPMYLAMLISLISFAYYIQHLASVPVILLFIGYMTRFQIIPEERMLTKIFGQVYIDYQLKVRRWL
jgi:protein-S-isoprenylcysteine O-methyltransferase Ste14